MSEVDEHQPHLDAVLDRKELVARDVLVVEVVLAGGAMLPPWSPGAHVDLVLGDTVRQYSLCGRTDDLRSYRLGIRVDPDGRGGSLAVAGSGVGRSVRLSLPRNHFELVEADDYLFVAGGIGITPFVSMIAEVERRGRPWRLVYGGRSRDTMAFVDELCTSHPTRVSVTTDDGDGPIDVTAALAGRSELTHVYCCGPEPLMAAVEQAMEGSRAMLHLERFTPRESPATADREFTVRLQSSGRELRVPPDRTLMQVLHDADVDVPFSCTEGTCGTCETRVVAGRIDHRDSILSPDEQESNEYMMVCVSRALDDELVIDR